MMLARGLLACTTARPQNDKEHECDSEMLVRTLPFLLWLLYGVRSVESRLSHGNEADKGQGSSGRNVSLVQSE